MEKLFEPDPIIDTESRHETLMFLRAEILKSEYISDWNRKQLDDAINSVRICYVDIQEGQENNA